MLKCEKLKLCGDIVYLYSTLCLFHQKTSDTFLWRSLVSENLTYVQFHYGFICNDPYLFLSIRQSRMKSVRPSRLSVYLKFMILETS